MNTPTLNVNLAPCRCGLADRAPTYPPTPHQDHCPAKPIPIPCHIPRSVTFTVVLGECACFKRNYVDSDSARLGHSDGCPARPIRVACSIGGKTWEDSHVEDCEASNGGWACICTGAGRGEHSAPCHGMAASERWALVKALVLGRHDVDSTDEDILRAWDRLFAQRDAVYAALADMARAEQMIQRSEQECAKHLPRTSVDRIGPSPAGSWLAAYVERLIEQVGVLGVGV